MVLFGAPYGEFIPKGYVGIVLAYESDSYDDRILQCAQYGFRSGIGAENAAICDRYYWGCQEVRRMRDNEVSYVHPHILCFERNNLQSYEAT